MIEWADNPDCCWTGQGYCEAPWLAKKYDDRALADLVAARVNGRVVPYRDRRQDRSGNGPANSDGCPF